VPQLFLLSFFSPLSSQLNPSKSLGVRHKSMEVTKVEEEMVAQQQMILPKL
jgi:hypothetical protein